MPTVNNQVTQCSATGSTCTAAQPAPARASDLLSGARAVLPAVVAFAPLALMAGAVVSASDDPRVAWLSTWAIHGGLASYVVLAAGFAALP
jgi:hypothetical protein